MKTIIIKENGTETVGYEFTEKELELLKKPLPDAPCIKCKDVDSSCVCPEYESYNKITQPYKDNGIFNLAFALREMTSLKKQINKLQEKYEEYEKELPPEVRDLLLEKSKNPEGELC